MRIKTLHQRSTDAQLGNDFSLSDHSYLIDRNYFQIQQQQQIK
jgi:hypothetical protein